MERLTRKKEDRFFENEEFWVSAEEPSIDKIDDVYFRLAEFEDLLEDLGIESVEELKRILTTNAIWQENQALKDRWEKLKEYLMYTLEEKQSSPKYYKFNNVLDKMKELEKED